MKNVIERILNLLAFLLTAGRPVTAAEIRRTVAGYEHQSDAAFHRMFERDKDLLRRIGIPMEVQATDTWGLEHGYSIAPDRYRMPDPGLNDEERAALWLAAQMVRIGGESAGSEALLKLGGRSMAAAVEPFAAELGAENETLATLFAGITERKLLTFDYRNRVRKVAPHGLGHARGHWYLVAVEGDETRVFRVDRIDSPKLGDRSGAFERNQAVRVRDALANHPWEIGEDATVKAKIRFDDSVAWWALRRLGRAEETPEGAVEVELSVANADAFVGWILGFGAGAEILEPQSLRDLLVTKVKESI